MLAGHETVGKTVSKLDALSHERTPDNPRFLAGVCAVGARKASQGPAQAAGRGYKDVRSD